MQLSSYVILTALSAVGLQICRYRCCSDASLPQKLTIQDNGETLVGSPFSVVLPVFGAIVIVVVGVTAAYPS